MSPAAENSHCNLLGTSIAPAKRTVASSAERLTSLEVTRPTAPLQHHLYEETVLSMTGGHVVVGPEGAQTRAERAASCLLAPEAGDRVLLSRRDDGHTFVLAVLTRGNHRAAAQLDVAGHLGNTRLTSQAGELQLEGASGLKLATEKTLHMSAGRAELIASAVTTIAKCAKVSLEEASVASKSLDTAVERLVTRATRAFRFVAEMDQTRAKHVDTRASGTARLSARGATLVTSDEVVKVDGSQVLIG